MSAGRKYAFAPTPRPPCALNRRTTCSVIDRKPFAFLRAPVDLGWARDEKMATLKDALTNVECLDNMVLPDEQPCIEPESASVVYEVSFDTNFADRTAFITGIGKYNEEATVCSKLVRACVHARSSAPPGQGAWIIAGWAVFGSSRGSKLSLLLCAWECNSCFA